MRLPSSASVLLIVLASGVLACGCSTAGTSRMGAASPTPNLQSPDH